MPIPELDANGYLPEGNYEATRGELEERFARGEYRMWFADTIDGIFEWAISRGASRIIVGGSFVSDRPKPSDLDLVIVFPNEDQIPGPTEHFGTFGGSQLDIYFASEATPDIVNAFIQLFSRSRDRQSVGVIIVRLPRGESQEFLFSEPPEQVSDLVHRLYLNRRMPDGKGPIKILIPVHGIKSHGEWYAALTEMCSSDGWIVAPFAYRYRSILTLFNPLAQASIVDAFREHLAVIAGRYKGGVSVIAHSFGSYVAMKYLRDFEDPPVHFDTLILAGSILNRRLDLSGFRQKVHWIINEVAPNDTPVRLVPVAAVFNSLLGTSGRNGFENVDRSFVTQTNGDRLFDHGNVIRRDVVYTRWLPRLNASVGRSRPYRGH